MKRPQSCVAVVNALSQHAQDRIGPAQLCLVVVRDAPGSAAAKGALAIRHTCDTSEELIEVLRDLALTLERHERSRQLRRARRLEVPKRLRIRA